MQEGHDITALRHAVLKSSIQVRFVAQAKYMLIFLVGHLSAMATRSLFSATGTTCECCGCLPFLRPQQGDYYLAVVVTEFVPWPSTILDSVARVMNGFCNGTSCI